jgi:hypothetical protein
MVSRMRIFLEQFPEVERKIVVPENNLLRRESTTRSGNPTKQFEALRSVCFWFRRRLQLGLYHLVKRPDVVCFTLG